MAVTSPDNIWTPDDGDDYALVQDLARTADDVQDALNVRVPLITGYARHKGKSGPVTQPAIITIPQGAVVRDQPLLVQTGIVLNATTVAFGNEYFPVETFPTPFPNALLGLTFTPLSGTGITRAIGEIAYDNASATSFRAFIEGSANPWIRGFSWIAMGY